MADSLSSVGFLNTGKDDYIQLYTQIQHEGEIITTTFGTYYRWRIPTEFDCAIEMWIKWSHDGEPSIIYPIFCNPMTWEIELDAALPSDKAHHHDGSFRFIYDRELEPDSEYVLHTPVVFSCPNFDCAEHLEMPYTANVQLCGVGADLSCYETEAEFLATYGSHPPTDTRLVEVIFASDYIIEGKPNLKAQSPIAYITGRVAGTQLVTNPVTGNDFSWVKIAVRDFGDVDVVAGLGGLHDFLLEGRMIKGTIRLAGRLLDV